MSEKNFFRLKERCKDPARLFSVFAVRGTLAVAEPYGSGHIHETFLLRTREPECPDYILQRLNRHVFRDIPGLMENIVRVSGHLRQKISATPGADPDREALTVIPTRDGRSFHLDGEGDFWRCYLFIEHQRPSERGCSPQHAFEAGKIFGRFIDLLADLPGPPLHETIPDFHNVEFHLENFNRLLRTDPLRRKEAMSEEITFARKRADDMKRVLVLGREGRIPLRVTHNDTKFNNILFDGRGRGVCVIDLDTVMPGYVLYDFGDAVRSAGNSAREDEPELGRVGLDMEVFRGFARGYMGELHGRLSAEETAHLAFSARLLTYMVGLRFLNDHLDGDRYFKITRPGHNLQRARVHFRLLQDMERRSAEMEDIVSALAAQVIF